MQAGWVSPLGELGPAPDGGSLTVAVRCRTERGGGGRRHPVVIAPDWSVEVPHDLAAARAGVGLGSYLSCLDLVDHVVPALADLMQLAARRRLPSLGRNHAGRWVVETPTAGCPCVQDSFGSPQEAADHIRTPQHLARRYGAGARELARLAAVVEQGHGGFAMCPPSGWHALALVREPRGLDSLWASGVPPEFVEEVQEAVLPTGGPLPTSAYLGAAYRCRDLAWLGATVAGRPDPDVAVWAAWSYGPGDRGQPGLRREWLALGVPRHAIDPLVAGGITVRLAEELADATGRNVVGAAQVLAAWERAGCRPGPGDIAALDQVGVGDSYEPVAVVIGSVLRAAERHGVELTRTQAAVLVAVAGTRAEAVRLLRRGVITPADALRELGRTEHTATTAPS